MFLFKRKTLQELLSIQVDLNRGIEEGLILKLLINKSQKIKQIHNSGFLISPTTNLFPLSGQSGNRGVSILITLKKQKVEYEFNNKIKYTTLQIISMLF